MLTLFAAVLLVTSDSLLAPGVSHELARYRAARVRDVRYDLTLDVTRRDTALGRVRISFSRAGAGDAILDFRGYSLTGLRVNGTTAPSERVNGHVAIAADLLRDGSNVVEVGFASPIAPAGASIIRFTDDTDKRDYLYTLLVPSDANLLFPCFDQPDLKAVFQLELVVPVTTDGAWHALSNTTVVADSLAPRRLGDAAAETAAARFLKFAPTRPIPTYLFAFAAGPFARLQDARKDITVWVRASRAREVETDTLIALNRRARDWLASYFGVPYPFPKLDFLLAPAFPFGGMEHPGAIFYNEESFIYREPPTLTQRLGRRATVFHEVAHQWFGDYTTMRWFDDLWMKEGFATYMAAKMQAAMGDSTAWMSFYLRNKPAAYDVDASAGTTPVWQELANLDQAKSNYGAIVYNKAPGVLKQLNHLVGEAAFKKGVHDFLATHAYGNATWQELLTSIGAAAGRDLTSWGRSYFLRPGMPVIEQQLTIGPNGRIQRLALIQHAAQPLSGAGAWPMKVDVRVQYGGPSPVMLPVELSAETTVVAGAVGLPAPNFVYANAADYGYGVFMLDERSRAWLLGRDATPRTAPGVVSVPDRFLRAMLWGSLWDQVRDARVDPIEYIFASLDGLQLERDEQIAPRLAARFARAFEDYTPAGARAELGPRFERLLLQLAADTTRSYSLRRSYLDAFIGIARSTEGLSLMNIWLDSTFAAGMPLRQPTRWSIITALVARGAPNAEARLATETARDTTTGGKRRSFIAGAAFARHDVKRAYFNRYFADSTLNEDWTTASLGAFNVADQAALTLPYLRPALDTLPWIQKNRRIFFLGSWLGAFIGGQRSPEALAEVDKFLTEHPELPRDLRLKILQARDDLERTVRIRAKFATRP